MVNRKIEEVASFYSYWSKYPLYYGFLSSFFGYQTYLKRKAISFASIRKGDVVLDAGCGPGNAFKKIRKIVGSTGRIIAVDCSNGMIQRCKKKVKSKGWGNVSVIKGDISKIKLKKIDSALALNSLSATPEHEKAIDNIYNALKNGGTFVVLDMIPDKFADILRYGKSYQKKDVLGYLKKKFKKIKVIKYPMKVFIAVAYKE